MDVNQSAQTPANHPEIQRLERALAGLMEGDFICEWLQTPNKAFDNLKPLEVVQRGEARRIWRMIYQLESGSPS